jgi:hypothetical protein
LKPYFTDDWKRDAGTEELLKMAVDAFKDVKSLTSFFSNECMTAEVSGDMMNLFTDVVHGSEYYTDMNSMRVCRDNVVAEGLLECGPCLLFHAEIK